MPEGCNLWKPRKYYAIIDEWGGDANKNTTCKLRNIASQLSGRNKSPNLLISDHMWIDDKYEDVDKIIQISKNYPNLKSDTYASRPIRGTRISFNAIVEYYDEPNAKAKLCHFEDIKVIYFDYWRNSCKNDNNDLWHGGFNL